MRRRLRILVAVVGAFLLLSAVGVLAANRSAVHLAGQSQWSTVFSDTFSTANPVWTVTDERETGYEWGISTYTRTVEAVRESDVGLWAAGGGSVGSGLAWSTDTYTDNMLTLAVAGPFTLSHVVADVQLTAEVLNRSVVTGGDQLYIELSRDGDNPIAWTEVPIDGENWQTITRTIGPVAGGDAIWIFMLFRSDQSLVDTGPLVDDVRLEVLQDYKVYLPLVRLDPTPTPMPVYHDDFANPSSGWYVGDAVRYNEYLKDGIFYERNEVVATMSYDNGKYQIYVPMDWRGPGGQVDTWFVWPAEMAPMPSQMQPLPECYSVETRARFNVDSDYNPWWAHWGLVFGADDSRSELYTFQINANHHIAMLRYENYTYPGNRSDDGLNVESPIYRWSGNSSDEFWSRDSYGHHSYDYSTLKVTVDGNVATFFVNGARVVSADISDMPRDRVGLIGGSWEYTPVEVEFDYFHYDATCSTP